jgi:hypothetical protein
MSPRISRLFVAGGISGVLGTLCYVVAITVSLNHIATYVLAMAWPILSIVFVFSLYRFIALDNQSAANQLAFVFACLAFALVAAMMSAQLAVKIGIEEYIARSTGNEQEFLSMMRQSIRLVDMGLDVAWDVFIGIALIFLSVALKGHHHFGLWWSIPSALLGIALIVLNVFTFPWPPDIQGLFDIGPAVGVYIIALSTRLFVLGKRMGRTLSND